MSELPNPFEFAGVVMPPADTAVVSLPHAPAPDAAATSFDSGAHTVSVPDEPATSLRQEDVAVEFPDIGEIFVGARKLNLPPFKLDEERFMAEIAEVPLFLRQAG